eukprot:533101_1
MPTTKHKSIMVHPINSGGISNTKQNVSERSRLMPTPRSNTRHLTYGTIIFLMINRSLNLVLYKAFTTFSWYFSQDFSMNYTLFALIAVMNFPGNLLNIAVVPYYNQFKVRYVIVVFELILAISCLIILPWHTVTGLLIARLMTGFAITAARSEVNASIGAFTYGQRRTRAISIVEMSFGFSAMGFLVVGVVLQHYGWRVFFVGAALLIVLISVLVMLIVPPWHIAYDDDITTTKKKYSYMQLKEALMHKRLQLVFVSVLLNKIARNAFYYTFSRWLFESYGLGPQQAGYITLFVAGGCLIGTTIVPIVVTRLGMSIHMACLLGSSMQVVAMMTEPIYLIMGNDVTLFGASIVIFFYFCGCQIWYNNILDIMIAVTPRARLLPAVNTILLAYGAFGGMIGTIGSTVWYQWGGEPAIASICAASNVGVSCIVILLWIAHKQHPYLRSNKEERQAEGAGFVTTKSEKKGIDIVADSSSMALRIVDTNTCIAGQSVSSLSNLQNINENQALLKA